MFLSLPVFSYCIDCTRFGRCLLYTSFKAAEADCIVTIGGGSSMDTAKAIGIIINNPEFADVRSLEGVAPTQKHRCV